MMSKISTATLKAVDKAIEAGRVETRIPSEIEQQAKALFEQRSLLICGVKWDWNEAGDETRNKWRLEAFIASH